MAVNAVLLMVGYRTKVAQMVALVLHVGMNGRVLLIENGGYVVNNLLLLWTVFLPLGDRFSVDALLASLRRRREITAGDLNDRVGHARAGHERALRERARHGVDAPDRGHLLLQRHPQDGAGVAQRDGGALRALRRPDGDADRQRAARLRAQLRHHLHDAGDDGLRGWHPGAAAPAAGAAVGAARASSS